MNAKSLRSLRDRSTKPHAALSFRSEIETLRFFGIVSAFGSARKLLTFTATGQP